MTSLYALHPSVLLSPSTDGYVAYHIGSNQLHELNPTAALLVELCNGSRTTAEILDLAAPLLPPHSDQAVQDWLEQATESELLLDVGGSATTSTSQAPGALEMSSDQLTALAHQLRDEGKVQAAYLCQERAVEIQDEDPGEALEKRWRDLGELAHITGRRNVARDAYEKYIALCPDDAEIQHLLTSLRDSSTPLRVPNECIQQLYERFSSYYEDNMCGELGYEGPVHLRKVIHAALGDRLNLSVLDLGCGTGLAGLAMKDFSARLVGVDLSPEMISHAEKSGVYDELHVAEVTEFLGRLDEKFDLIMACDTLIYFGDLKQVLLPASQHLAEHGVLAFSVERAPEEAAERSFLLTDNGRYVHHPDHIAVAATAANLTVVKQLDEFLRMEYGEEVNGLYVSLRVSDAKPA